MQKTFDPSRASDRRRFFLNRALRRRSIGSGSDLRGIMDSVRQNHADMPAFDGLQAMLIGAHAAAMYAPERNTSDVDIIVAPQHVAEAEARLQARGWEKKSNLVFPSSNIGLYGSAWKLASRPDIDIISTEQEWLQDAYAAPQVINRWDQRVMPLPYLVLMKFDAARAHDQGDLSRMLGRLEPSAVEEIITVAARHSPDSEIAEEIRQYAEIGRWEYMSEGDIKRDGERA